METGTLILTIAGWLIGSLATIVCILVSRRLSKAEDGIEMLRKRTHDINNRLHVEFTEVREAIADRPTRAEITRIASQK